MNPATPSAKLLRGDPMNKIDVANRNKQQGMLLCMTLSKSNLVTEETPAPSKTGLATDHESNILENHLDKLRHQK
jgi:hypothetical protein